MLAMYLCRCKWDDEKLQQYNFMAELAEGSCLVQPVQDDHWRLTQLGISQAVAHVSDYGNTCWAKQSCQS